MKQNYVGRYIKIIHNIIDAGRNRSLKLFEITSSQAEVLLFLHKHEQEEIYQKDIERELKCKNPTVTGILNRLEGKGFIQRVSSSEDARLKKIVLTQKAKDIHQIMCSKKSKVDEKMLKGFSEAEVEQLENLLEKMIKNLSV